MDQWILKSPRWLMLVALVYAPWAYGTTRPWAITGLNYLLGTVFVLWAIGYALRQKWPSIHPVLAVSVLGLFAQAWFMVLNARYDYDELAHEFIPRTPLFSWAPGSMHRSLSLENAAQFTAILMALCVVSDIVRSSQWRKALLWTMALTGTSVVILGLAQRLTNATAVMWGPESMGRTFFATYRYHANAGAFMNLVWPIVAGFAALAFLRGSAKWKKALWTAALVLCLAGVIANTSRAAGALGLLLAVLWGAWILWQIARGRLAGLSPAMVSVIGLVMLLLVISLAALAGLDTTVSRWSHFDREVSDQNTRLLSAKVCLRMAPEAGWWGFGPGTFQTTFPYFTHEFGNKLRGRWYYAHQDYLQTVVEWGYIGAIGWAVVVFGAIAHAVSRAFRERDRLTHAAAVHHFAVLVALFGVLTHALVDFPLQIASIQLYTATLLGMLWGARHWIGDSESRPRRDLLRNSLPRRRVTRAPAWRPLALRDPGQLEA
jgi:O-antigen ligase